jgi:hypothetical protein
MVRSRRHNGRDRRAKDLSPKADGADVRGGSFRSSWETIRKRDIPRLYDAALKIAVAPFGALSGRGR